MPGVFDHQMNAANRVLANVEHEPASTGSSPRASRCARRRRLLRKLRCAEHAERRHRARARAEGVLEASRSRRAPAEAVRATKASCSASRRTWQASRSAGRPRSPARKVLAVREEDIVVADLDETVLRPDGPELLARCRALGIKTPAALPGPPSTTRTPPAPTGTSAAAPPRPTKPRTLRRRKRQ
jgi:hypothetical protein